MAVQVLLWLPAGAERPRSYGRKYADSCPSIPRNSYGCHWSLCAPETTDACIPQLPSYPDSCPSISARVFPQPSCLVIPVAARRGLCGLEAMDAGIPIAAQTFLWAARVELVRPRNNGGRMYASSCTAIPATQVLPWLWGLCGFEATTPASDLKNIPVDLGIPHTPGSQEGRHIFASCCRYDFSKVNPGRHRL